MTGRPTAVVLAGGLARRLGGGDKPLRPLGGRTILEHVIARIRPQAGRTWLERLTGHFRRSVWLNPGAERLWSYTMSVGLVRDAMQGRMFPLTLGGLDAMTRELSR